MKNYFYLNPSKMVEIAKDLSGSEIKMLYGIIYCLSVNGSEWFVNNTENRDRIAEVGFDKTRERLGNILSSLVKKGVLKRETQGVYTLPEGLFIDADKVEVKLPK